MTCEKTFTIEVDLLPFLPNQQRKSSKKFDYSIQEKLNIL